MFQPIFALFKKIGDILLAIFVPAVATRRSESRVGRWIVAGIHVAGVIAVVSGLLLLQWGFGLDRFIRSSSWLLRAGWLPVVALMFYGLAWSCWYLAKVLRMPSEASSHGDISDAWRRAKDRIARSGVNLQNTPLFLVLGRPTGGIHHFFSAAGLSLTVPPTPADDDAPIRVCGNQDALFVCCDRVSLLDDFVHRLAAKELKLKQTNTTVDGQSVLLQNEPEAHCWEASETRQENSRTINARNTASSTSTSTATIDRPQPTSRVRSETEAKMTSQFDQLEKQLAEAERIVQPTLANDDLTSLETDVATAINARLDYLCRLIIEERDPYCPINGIVLMVPIYATESDELADHVGMRIEHDLETMTTAVETGVPVQMIITGLETCVGSRELLNRFPKTQRDRRLGAVIPVAPASEPAAQAAMIEQTCAWLCDELFPPLVARLLHRDLADAETDAVLRRGNRRLHELVQSMRSRRFRLSRLMRRAIATQDKNLSFRGCYLTATGADAIHGQAFTAGVVPMILGCQNEVRWLESRRKRNQLQLGLVVAGYVTIALIAAAMFLTFST